MDNYLRLAVVVKWFRHESVDGRTLPSALRQAHYLTASLSYTVNKKWLYFTAFPLRNQFFYFFFYVEKKTQGVTLLY